MYGAPPVVSAVGDGVYLPRFGWCVARDGRSVPESGKGCQSPGPERVMERTCAIVNCRLDSIPSVGGVKRIKCVIVRPGPTTSH